MSNISTDEELWTMRRYAYRTIWETDIDRDTGFDEEINALAKEGWRVVGVFGGGGDNQPGVIMEREGQP